jgi:hypothetical protein
LGQVGSVGYVSGRWTITGDFFLFLVMGFGCGSFQSQGKMALFSGLCLVSFVTLLRRRLWRWCSAMCNDYGKHNDLLGLCCHFLFL